MDKDIEDKLQRYVKDIMAHGPARVLIDRDGSAVPSRSAREFHGIVPDVIFIRDDGWSLGAPSGLESSAENLWKNEWIGVLRRPSTSAEPYRR